MSGLFRSLQFGVKALNAQSQGVETAGRNLANVNNASYARQRVEFGDRGTIMTPSGPMSLGLEALRVVHLRDGLLDQQYIREASRSAELTMTQSGLQMAQAALGQNIDRTTGTGSTADGAHGLAETMADFFNACYSLAAKPSDVGEKQTLLQRAGILVDRFRLTDSRLAQVQSDMSSQIRASAEEANTILANLADINEQISRFEVNNPGAAVDLRDRRQQNLEALGRIMSFETRPQTNTAFEGQIQVFTRDEFGNEVVLVELGDCATLSVNADASQVAITQIVGPNTGVSANLAITSGEIKGAMDARDGATQTLRDNLDALAQQLVTSINAVYSASGDNFFDPAGVTAATIALDSDLSYANLAAGVGSSGDNSLALGIAQLSSQAFTTAGGAAIDGTFTDFYNETVTELGQTLEGVNTRLSDQETIAALVKSHRDAVSGVSLDEEMADLMKFQRAFQASTRVISVIDDLLDTVINRLGRV